MRLLGRTETSGEHSDKRGALQLILILKLENSPPKGSILTRAVPSAGAVPSCDGGTSLRPCIIFQESEGHLACCKGGPGMSFFFF